MSLCYLIQSQLIARSIDDEMKIAAVKLLSFGHTEEAVCKQILTIRKMTKSAHF